MSGDNVLMVAALGLSARIGGLFQPLGALLTQGKTTLQVVEVTMAEELLLIDSSGDRLREMIDFISDRRYRKPAISIDFVLMGRGVYVQFEQIQKVLRYPHATYYAERSDGEFDLVYAWLNPILGYPLESLDLGVRAYNLVKGLGIRTIGGLAAMTEDQLNTTPGIGKKVTQEIKGALADYGLSLRVSRP